jgi:hypothetical protein
MRTSSGEDANGTKDLPVVDLEVTFQSSSPSNVERCTMKRTTKRGFADFLKQTPALCGKVTAVNCLSWPTILRTSGLCQFSTVLVRH